MAQLPNIYTIQASDAPQHTGKFQEILQQLKRENRIEDFTAIGPEEDLSSITSSLRDGDLVLVLLTDQLESRKDQIESKLKTHVENHPNIKVAEIIVDHVIYDNDFIAFPADLKPIRDREDMDEVWSSIERNLKVMLPAKKEPVAVSSIDWPKYLKIAGIIIGVVLVFFLIRGLWSGDDRSTVDRPETEVTQSAEDELAEEDVAEPVEEEAEPVTETSSVNLDFTDLGNSGLLGQRLASTFAEQGIQRIRAVPSGNYCSDARPAILAEGTYRAPVSFLSTASPGGLNSCNTIPLEFEFASPVREVTINFYGAASDYLLVPYDESGNRLGSASAQGQPYDYNSPFNISYTSDKADISRVTFGRQAALTMVLDLKATR